MSSPRDTSERLARLEQILSQTDGARTVIGDTANPAEVHLSSIPAERIRLLTAELKATGSGECEPADALLMKLLLNEYCTALGHLRAVARMSAATVDGAAAPMRDMERAVHRCLKDVDRRLADWLARNTDHH